MSSSVLNKCRHCCIHLPLIVGATLSIDFDRSCVSRFWNSTAMLNGQRFVIIAFSASVCGWVEERDCFALGPFLVAILCLCVHWLSRVNSIFFSSSSLSWLWMNKVRAWAGFDVTAWNISLLPAIRPWLK